MGYIYVVVGGAGRSGSVIVKDLLSPFSRDVDKVIAVDVNKERLERLLHQVRDERLEVEVCNARDRNSLARILRRGDVCINAALYYVNIDVMYASLEAKTPYIDLGSFFHPVLEQKKLHGEFIKNNVIGVICAGTAPGATNIMAKYLVEQLDTVDSIHIRDGYAFTNPTPPVLISPYSVVVLLEEYFRPCVFYVNGEFVTLPPRSEEEEHVFPDPVGKVKCICADHEEVATFPEAFRYKGLKNVTWKLGLPKEVDDIVRALIAAGFDTHEPVTVDNTSVDPLFIAEYVATRNLTRFMERAGLREIPLYEVLRVIAEGRRGGLRSTYILDMHCPPPKAETGTGEAASVIAQIVSRKKDELKPGVWAPEEVIDPPEFFEEMKKRGYKFILTRQEEI